MRNDGVEATILEGQLMAIANLEFKSVADRVPVSLGIVLDTSGSDKIANARAAIERFLDRLLTADDEVFLYGFSTYVERLQEWTTNREAVSAALRRVRAVGGTAMCDAVVQAVPVAQRGRNSKKAVVLISDGNDTDSQLDMSDVRHVVRESEVLVYAVGIDGEGQPAVTSRPPTFPPTPPSFPVPGRRRPPRRWPVAPQFPPTSGRTSGGHRDGRWHAIRVEVRDLALRVRARRGYTATF